MGALEVGEERPCGADGGRNQGEAFLESPGRPWDEPTEVKTQEELRRWIDRMATPRDLETKVEPQR